MSDESGRGGNHGWPCPSCEREEPVDRTESREWIPSLRPLVVFAWTQTFSCPNCNYEESFTGKGYGSFKLAYGVGWLP